MFSLTFLLYSSHVFSLVNSIVITSIGEEITGFYASRAFVCLSCMRCSFVFFSSRCQGSANCDCETSWTFHKFLLRSEKFYLRTLIPSR